MGKVGSRRGAIAALFALGCVWYALLLAGGKSGFFPPPQSDLGLTFNSMLARLPLGHFDVDPAAIGPEAIYQDGRAVAYFGIFCALIRWPLALFPGGLSLNVTRISCLVAVCLAAFVKLKTLQFAASSRPASPTGSFLFWPLALSILFAGPQIEFLNSSIYVEVCLWAAALAAVFVYLGIRGLVRHRFSSAGLCGMAAVAGLALLCRVSTGVGLYAATGLLLLSMWLRGQPGSPPGDSGAGEARPEPATWRQVLWPVLLLGVSAALAGFVNYRRWGNPLLFADYHNYALNGTYAERYARMQADGFFNLHRVPFGLLYYFLPIWVLRGQDGHLLFEAQQARWVPEQELPPSSFVATDPLFLFLLLYAAFSLARRRSPAVDRALAFPIGVGLAVPWVLLLSAIYTTLRYRLEFYPLLEFGGFVGFLLLWGTSREEGSSRRLAALARVSAAVGIVASHWTLFLSKLSEFGPAADKLRGGVLAYYLLQIHQRVPRLGHWLPF